jgi:competence protein ComGC
MPKCSIEGKGFTADAFLMAVLVIFLFVLYWVPSIVAANRHVKDSGSVYVINFLLGWTLIGWAVALAMACRDARKTA